jgi:hypothetical protein
MKNKLINIIPFLFSIGFLLNCEDADISRKDYPFIETLPVNNITENGVTFSAKISSKGISELIDYGFVWGSENDPTIDNYRFSAFSMDSNNNDITSYFADITFDIFPQRMFVRSYVQNEDFLVYGNSVAFEGKGSMPVEVIDFFPKKSTLAGNQIKVFGRNFSTYTENNKVMLGEIELKVLKAYSDSLVVLSPVVEKTEQLYLRITVQGNSATFDEPFELIYPWKRVSDFPGEQRVHYTAFTIGEFAYIGGGGDPPYNPKKDFYRYNPINDSWSSIQDFKGVPRDRSTNVNEVGLAFGIGVSSSGGAEYFTDAWLYNSNENEWKEVIKEKIPTVEKFYYLNARVIENNSSLYVYFSNINEFWKFNILDSSWIQLNAPSIGISDNPDQTFRISVKKNGLFYYFSKNSIWSYDPATEQWTKQREPGIIFYNGIINNDQLYVFARQFYEYDFENHKLKEIAIVPEGFITLTYFSVNDNLFFLSRSCISCPSKLWKFDH